LEFADAVNFGCSVNCPHCQAPVVADARFCPACGKATSPTESGSGWPPASGAPDNLSGREIAGRYRINKKLGEGGMGAVYRGEQISLKRSVAVKLLRPELSQNQMILQRFNAEAQAVAKLSHPNTVNIYDFGQDSDGTLFIAMEYIEGKSLREAIQQEGPFSVTRALAIALQVAAALSDAHAQGIVHRDLKPDNVMLQARGKQKDVVRVLDFGIAKLRDENRSTQAAMTQQGDMLGTPQYMAPEQIKGEAIDGRTDVYALGCMIYEMVTARLPFEGTTIMAMLSKHLVEDPIPPTQRRPELNLPPALDQLILQAMQKEPKDRAANMEAFADQMGALLGQLPPDPNSMNRSGALSMQQGAVAGVPTPPPSAFRPMTPPPPGPASAAFTPATPFPAAPAPGFPPPMGPPPGVPYAPAPASQPAPAYSPPPIAATQPVAPAFVPPPPPVAPTAIVSRPKSKAPIYALVGLLAVGGGGAGIYFATKKKSDTATTAHAGSGSAQHDEPDKPETPDPTPGSGDDPWAANNDPSITKKNPPVTPPTPVEDDPPDPPEPDPVDPQPASVGTNLTPIPKGAYLTPPAGFTKVAETPQGISYSNVGTGEILVMAPLAAGTNDPSALAQQYSHDTGAEFKQQDKLMSAGANRTALLFTSQSAAGPLVHIAALYITDTYRLGVLYIVPAQLATEDTFEAKAQGFFSNGVHLP
jgi:serine/threonine-protein kinase